MEYLKILFPSLIRKKVINRTDRIPILKLPIWDIIELNSLVTKLKSISEIRFKSVKKSNKLIFWLSKYFKILTLVDSNFSLNSFVLSNDKFLPCFERIGTNNPITKEKNETRKEIEIIDDKVLLILNLHLKNLFNGLIIRVRIKAIKIYSNPNLILNKTHANKPRKDNVITDFTNSFEFIYN